MDEITRWVDMIIAGTRDSEQPQSDPDDSLEAVLSGRAVELWSDSTGRLFLVADQSDVERLTHSDDSIGRGEVYTAAEIRRIITIADPQIVAEIHAYKRRFDGVVSEIQGESVTALERKATDAT